MTQTFLKTFRQELTKKNVIYRKIGIERILLKPYTQTAYPPDEYSKKIMEIGNFDEAFIYRARMNDMNVVIVLGTQGRGKTNIFKKAIDLGTQLGAPFSWGRNLYIGEGTIIHRKYLANRHETGEQVINDEAEFLNRPNSKQLRDLMWTLSSGRDSGLHFWFCFPTTKDTQFTIWDSHANWLFWVLKRDQKNRMVEYKLFYRITFESPFYPSAWVEYPHVGAKFWQPFLEQSVFDEYKLIKDTIYDEDISDDWYVEKKQYDKGISDTQRQKQEQEFLLKVEEIASSNLPKESKIVELYKIKYPKYKMVKKLKTSMPTINSVLDELTVSKIKMCKDIFISTKRENIENEMRENMDPDHLDFWPVSTYPKDIILGESRLYLAVGQEKVASFIIEGKGEEEWRGVIKKVLYLKKESVRRESGMTGKNSAMGGYSYL